jgi:hypothetical protein
MSGSPLPPAGLLGDYGISPSRRPPIPEPRPDTLTPPSRLRRLFKPLHPLSRLPHFLLLSHCQTIAILRRRPCSKLAVIRSSPSACNRRRGPRRDPKIKHAASPSRSAHRPLLHRRRRPPKLPRRPLQSRRTITADAPAVSSSPGSSPAVRSRPNR